jgi:hypothetical protein
VVFLVLERSVLASLGRSNFYVSFLIEDSFFSLLCTEMKRRRDTILFPSFYSSFLGTENTMASHDCGLALFLGF